LSSLNLRSLEQKLNTLKRAVTIIERGDDGALEILVRKWKEVGCNIAWDLWSAVKNQDVTQWGISGEFSYRLSKGMPSARCRRTERRFTRREARSTKLRRD
jgi:hypothetical protein